MIDQKATKTLESLSVEILKLEGVVAELKALTPDHLVQTTAPVEVTEPTETAPATVPHRSIEIKMAAGKGYGWLATQLNAELDGFEGFSVLTGDALRGRMGGQMLYKGHVYCFASAEVLVGGPLSGGLDAADVARAQKAGEWWREEGRDQWLAEQSEKEQKEAVIQILKAKVEQGGGDGSVLTTEDVAVAELLGIKPVDLDLKLPAGDGGGSSGETAAPGFVTTVDGLGMAATFADFVKHGHQTIPAMQAAGSSQVMMAAGAKLGVMGVGAGMLKIDAGLENPDDVEGTLQVVDGALTAVGGVLTTASAVGVGGTTVAAAGPALAAGALGLGVGHHADEVSGDQGVMLNKPGESISEGQIRRGEFVQDIVQDLTGSEVVGQTARVVEAWAESPLVAAQVGQTLYKEGYGMAVDAIPDEAKEWASDRVDEAEEAWVDTVSDVEDTLEEVEEAWDDAVSDAGDFVEDSLDTITSPSKWKLPFSE